MRIKFLCFSQNTQYRICLLLSASALVLGGTIYILFYTSQPVFFNWIRAAGMNNWLSLARHYSLSASSDLPQWIIYSLPDGLWAFAYAVLITGIWIRNHSGLKYFWMSTIPVLIIGLELLQYTGMVRGTFSFQDIAFEISGLLFGIYIGIKITKSHPHEKSIA
jgi:hypothetical protein